MAILTGDFISWGWGSDKCIEDKEGIYKNQEKTKEKPYNNTTLGGLATNNNSKNTYSNYYVLGTYYVLNGLHLWTHLILTVTHFADNKSLAKKLSTLLNAT